MGYLYRPGQDDHAQPGVSRSGLCAGLHMRGKNRRHLQMKASKTSLLPSQNRVVQPYPLHVGFWAA